MLKRITWMTSLIILAAMFAQLHVHKLPAQPIGMPLSVEDGSPIPTYAQTGSSPTDLSVIGYTSWNAQSDTLTAAANPGGTVDLYWAPTTCPTDPTQLPAGALPLKTGIGTTAYNYAAKAGKYCFYLRVAGAHTGTPNYLSVVAVTSSSKTTVTETKANSKMTQLVINVSSRDGGGPMPTGYVSFNIGTSYQVFSETLANGTVTIQLPTAILKKYVVAVNYSGDPNYGTSNYNCTPGNTPQ